MRRQQTKAMNAGNMTNTRLKLVWTPRKLTSPLVTSAAYIRTDQRFLQNLTSHVKRIPLERLFPPPRITPVIPGFAVANHVAFIGKRVDFHLLEKVENSCRE